MAKTIQFKVKYGGEPLNGEVVFSGTRWPYKARAEFDTHYIRDKKLKSTLEELKLDIEVDEDGQYQWLTVWGDHEIVTDELRILLCETIKAIMKQIALSEDTVLYTFFYPSEIKFYNDLGFEESVDMEDTMISTFGNLLEKCQNRIYEPREARMAAKASEWVKSGKEKDRNSLKATWEQYCGTSGYLKEEYDLSELRGLAKAFGIKNRHKMRKEELCQRIATFITIMETGIHPQNLLALEIV